MTPARATSVDGALRQAHAAGVERLDAQALLAQVLGRDRAWLIAHGDDALPAERQAAWEQQLAQLAAGVPLAYVLGRKEFHGLDLAVSPAVLIPRADTETLVDWALDLLPPDLPRAVLDLGTGSGAIALALRARRPATQVTAADVSADSLEVARGNAASLGYPVEFLQGSWWEPVAGRRFDLVVSNPPYIAERDPHLAALAHEPQHALTSGPDGLDAIRSLVGQARDHLRPGGWLLLEHGWDQAAAVAGLLAGAGLEQVSHRQDLAGHVRCTGARL